MTSDGLGWLGLVFIVGVAAGVSLRVWWLQTDLARLQEREFWWDEFDRRARTLLADDGVPVALISVLRTINTLTVVPGAVYTLMKIASRPGAEWIGDLDTVDRFRRERPEMGSVLDRAVVAGVLATTYQKGLTGALARAALFSMAKRQQDETVVYIREARATQRKLALA